MTIPELVAAYFVVGSVIPIIVLCMHPDNLGIARLAAGLDNDKRFTAAILMAFFFWPLVIIIKILVMAGIIDLKDY